MTGLNVSLSAGQTYWLNLQNATVPSGDPVYWDENDGVGCGGDDGKGGGCPSEADWTSCILRNGPLCPPESFDINGTGGEGTTPEPASFILVSSGILGLGSMLRRKFM